MPVGRRARSAAVLLGLVLAPSALAAEPPPSPGADEALTLCARAGRTEVAADKRALLTRGLALAEKAVARDERDARAHFAVFCNLGKQMELRGNGVGSLVELPRLRREIDRTLALAPDFPDALVGKASLLLSLPGLLGGDARAGEALLRRALAIDPDYIRARLRLAEALVARGAGDEARTEARRALEVAERKDDRESVEKARALLHRLGG